MLLKLHSFINNIFINCFKTFSYLRKNILLYGWKILLILDIDILFQQSMLVFVKISRTNNKWFLLAICLPQNTIFVAKSKGFQNFYPHTRGLASLLLGYCPPSLHTLRNLEHLSHRSPWKCYPTSNSAAYYPHSKHDLTNGLYFLLNISYPTFVSIPISFQPANDQTGCKYSTSNTLILATLPQEG
jgi:hypothetical protein